MEAFEVVFHPRDSVLSGFVARWDQRVERIGDDGGFRVWEGLEIGEVAELVDDGRGRRWLNGRAMQWVRFRCVV